MAASHATARIGVTRLPHDGVPWKVDQDPESGLVAHYTPITPSRQVQIGGELLLGLGEDGRVVEIESLADQTTWEVERASDRGGRLRFFGLRVVGAPESEDVPVDLVTNKDRSLLACVLCIGAEPIQIVALGPKIRVAVDSRGLLVSLTMSWERALASITPTFGPLFARRSTYERVVRRRLKAVRAEQQVLRGGNPSLAARLEAQAARIIEAVAAGLGGVVPSEIPMDPSIGRTLREREIVGMAQAERRVISLATAASVLFDRPISWH